MGLLIGLSKFKVPQLLAAECTCRTLRRIIPSDPLLWHHIELETNGLTNSRLLRLVDRAQGQLETLRLIGCEEITAAALIQAARGPNITEIFISDCHSSVGQNIVNVVMRIIQQNSGLNQLKLFGIPDTTVEHKNEVVNMWENYLKKQEKQVVSIVRAGICVECHKSDFLLDSNNEGFYSTNCLACEDYMYLDCCETVEECSNCGGQYCTDHSEMYQQGENGLLCENCIDV